MKVLIGGAWPYANGSLHLGHVAGLLSGDILARYYRQKGDEVLYVSGSDCHGTPIALRAKEEGVNPSDIADKYHNEFSKCFEKLGFTYDNYTRTDNPNHHRVVQEVFKKLLDKGYIYEKTIEQTYCETCGQFLPDRYVEGTCPHCGNIARGDQCDYCSSLLDPSELIDRKCKICGGAPVNKETKHLFFALSKFQDKLDSYVESSKGWRENAVNLTKRYLNEGLQDRAATRDLTLGIDVPVDGYDGKKIYVWIEAVLGYLSASIEWSQKTGGDYKRFWEEDDTIAYYVHGKDNIPFHTLILPGLLLGLGGKKLPDRIISSEYLTIEGKKLSTSRNWAVWVPYIVENYNPDAVRYFLTINGPDKRDADFSWREFINSNNGELLGAFGNFVNRSLVFAEKYFDRKVPEGKTDSEIERKIKELYSAVGKKIEDGDFKEALEDIFAFIRSANKYFDREQPWVTIKDNKEKCKDTIYNCIVIIANLSNLLSPFIPFACEKIREFIDIQKGSWSYIEPNKEGEIRQPEILFERIDKSKIDEEIKKLGQQG
jgi:methionyl-tRNA synthetase